MIINMPDFEYESRLWSEGLNLVCGVDEVGRGSFAGPVVAACVGFRSGTTNNADIRIDDSKVLTQKMREKAEVWIKQAGAMVGIGSANIEEINEVGVGRAGLVAMRRAVKNAGNNLGNENDLRIEHLLVDAFYIPWVRGLPKSKQTPIIKGDALSYSIAAASIVAKVYRDKLMVDLSRKENYHVYGWHQNKGYGTKAHREAILEHGVTTYHRREFVNTFLIKSKIQGTE